MRRPGDRVAPGLKAVAAWFVVLFAAEWGDLSQLLTISMIAEVYGNPGACSSAPGRRCSPCPAWPCWRAGAAAAREAVGDPLPRRRACAWCWPAVAAWELLAA